jgi:hypothetical protein
MNTAVHLFAILSSVLSLFASTARALDCQTLFRADNSATAVQLFSGPVEASHSGEALPREIQHELIRLSNMTEGLEKLFPTNLVHSVPSGKDFVLSFAGSGHVAQLKIFNSGARWSLSTTGSSLSGGQSRKLARDVDVADLSRDLTLQLVLHMQAIRDFFEIQTAASRDDLLRSISTWAKASDEDPFQGDIVNLLLASRKERFHLDRGFEKGALTDLSDKSKRKMAALTLLVERGLVFSLGPDRRSPGIYRPLATKAWSRISSSDESAQTDRTVLLFQAMTNAGFKYESGVYH